MKRFGGEAVVLAGGLGTRLRSVLPDLPKPMADICGRPFLSYLLDHLSSAGVGKVILSVGYKSDLIRGYFGGGYAGMEIGYVVEDRPLGTGGAIREAMKASSGDDVLVLNGDTFFNIDIENLLERHFSDESSMTIAVKPMRDFDRYGTVVVENHRIAGFREKTFMSFGYINGGIYVINKGLMRYFDRFPENFSIETDFLQKRPGEIAFSAYIDDGYFIDIGIPEEYRRAQEELPSIFRGLKR